ncbi:hypothetical protein [Staphylococcus delphini]|nr:hypothetical protein [Staphylococcus delphini]
MKDYRGEISMDKKLEAYIPQLLEELENLEGVNIKKTYRMKVNLG